MPVTSAILNRALRKSVVPLLREASFAKVDARNGWLWLEKVVWVFNIRAVGHYFSSVTGWPPGSVGASLGIFFRFMPRDFPIKQDSKGRLLPAEHLCQMRLRLERGLDQDESIGRLVNAAERRRKDLWWVEPDGGNCSAVAEDIAWSLREHGLSWFARYSNLPMALAKVERSHDCFIKFDTATFLAREIGDTDRWHRYAMLAETESNHIGRRINREARYGV